MFVADIWHLLDVYKDRLGEIRTQVQFFRDCEPEVREFSRYHALVEISYILKTLYKYMTHFLFKFKSFDTGVGWKCERLFIWDFTCLLDR